MENQSVLYRHLTSLLRRRIPGQLIIQVTDACNARCPQCGMRVMENFQRSRLSVEYIKRLLDAAVQKGVKIVSFTGGEPLLFLDDLIVLINYAGEVGFKYIRTGTNGFIFRNSSGTHFRSRVTRIVEALAATPLRNFWISIDSAVPSVHETMRGFPGIIAGLEKTLPIFHDHGIYPSANLGINRNIGKQTANILQRHPVKDQGYFQTFYQEFQIAFSQFYRYRVSKNVKNNPLSTPN